MGQETRSSSGGELILPLIEFQVEEKKTDQAAEHTSLDTQVGFAWLKAGCSNPYHSLNRGFLFFSSSFFIFSSLSPPIWLLHVLWQETYPTVCLLQIEYLVV